MTMNRSRKTSLVSIASVLKSSQNKTQFAFTISKLRRVWKDIVGDLLASQTKPKKIERNILWVSVDNSALNYELSLMKPSILEKIHETTPERYKDIKFVHETVKKPDAESEQPSRRKFVRTQAQEGETLDSILKRVKTLSKDLQKKRQD